MPQKTLWRFSFLKRHSAKPHGYWDCGFCGVCGVFQTTPPYIHFLIHDIKITNNIIHSFYNFKKEKQYIKNYTIYTYFKKCHKRHKACKPL